MDIQKDNRFAFAALSAYPLKQRLTIRLAGLVFHLAIRVVGSLTRFEIESQDSERLAVVDGLSPIYVYWHDRMFLTIYFLRDRGALFLTSRSFDGEYLARIFQRFGYGIVRGSSSSGGSEALARLTEGIKEGRSVSLTVDGPRGPRYESKIGAIVLAKRTGMPVLPIIIESKRFRTMNSWDRLQVPYPFSSAAVFVGDPIHVRADATSEDVDEAHHKMQLVLDSLVERGRQWRESR